jgi:putative flippase GtrA
MAKTLVFITRDIPAQLQLLFLTYPVLGRLVRFLGVGLVGLACDSALFWALFQSGASAQWARGLSLPAATLVTWALNRIITFEPSGRAWWHELLRYAGVAALVQGFNYLLFLSLVYGAALHPLLALLISAVAAAALSFAGQSLITFAQRPRGRTDF